MRKPAFAVVVCLVVVFSSDALFGASNSNRSARGTFAVELDGKFAGYTNEIGGGFATADVLLISAGLPYYKKDLRNPDYTEIDIAFNTGMSSEFYQAISDAMAGNKIHHNGKILALNGKNIVRQLEFTNALITEVTFPAADASSKDTAKFVVTFKPDQAVESKKSGTYSNQACSVKPILAGNFRFDVKGLNLAAKTEAVDGMTAVLAVPDTNCGLECPPPPLINFPSVIATIQDSGAQLLLDWYNDFVIAGNTGDANEKNGSIEWLDASLNHVLLRVDFYNMGVFEVANDVTAAVLKPNTVAGSFYVENMQFSDVAASCKTPTN